MNRTQREEEKELDAMFEREKHEHEPRYPLIERTDVAQIGKTVINFVDYDSEGGYITQENT